MNKIRKLLKIIKIRRLAWTSLKKWRGSIYDISDGSCVFCWDASHNCNKCLAPKYLCNMENKDTLYNIWKIYYDGKRLMCLALLSLVIFGFVIFPIKWMVKRIIKKYEYGKKS